MRQILQSLKTGQTELVEVPAPRVRPGSVRIDTTTTLVSAGTERMLLEFGKANWFEKARQQPDKVRMVLDKVRTDGLAATFETVQSKLDQPLALGYCNVGVVSEVGSGIGEFKVGDRVVSNGHHAEIVVAPRNLCARIPDNVSDEHASFTVLSAIGLQGVRLANPTLGESVAVIGLGLIGLLTVQILKAQGCRVLGLDLDPSRLEMAKRFGAEVVPAGADPVATALAFSRGRGMDAVLITASTSSNEPVRQAAHMCRKRGRIVLVGVTGLELSRADFFEKELTFQVSCSYGPGRYDPAYEDGGHDYPVGYVRWTEQRNFEAALDLMSAGAMDIAPLISHRFELDRALEAYELLSSGQPSLGIVLSYPPAAPAAPVVRRIEIPSAASGGAPGATVSFLGAGNYATRSLMPAFKAAGARLHAVTSAQGVSAVHFGRKHGFAVASSDEADTIADPAAQAIVIATRHNAHARQVLAALGANKHIFCEKPLCLTLSELDAIETAASAAQAPMVMVGFNRRFAPHVKRMKTLLETVSGPKSLIMTVNAGAIPADHWTQDQSVGGGRIVGEACHFIDLMRHLVGAPIVEYSAVALGRHPSLETTDDKAVLTLRFGDGSVGTIHYLANGHKAVAKERLEVFCAGRILQLDNFRSLRGYGWSGFSRMNRWSQDKGQTACVAAFVDAMKAGGPSPIALDEVLEVSRVSIELQKALEA